jgi:hypothetical protein
MTAVELRARAMPRRMHALHRTCLLSLLGSLAMVGCVGLRHDSRSEALAIDTGCVQSMDAGPFALQ